MFIKIDLIAYFKSRTTNQLLLIPAACWITIIGGSILLNEIGIITNGQSKAITTIFSLSALAIGWLIYVINDILFKRNKNYETLCR